MFKPQETELSGRVRQADSCGGERIRVRLDIYAFLPLGEDPIENPAPQQNLWVTVRAAEGVSSMRLFPDGV